MVMGVGCHTVFDEVIALRTPLDLDLLPELRKHGGFPPHHPSPLLGEKKCQRYETIKGKRNSC